MRWHRWHRAAAAALGIALLASCATTPDAPEPTQADGQWFYKADSTLGPMALFGPPNTEPDVTIRCDETQQRVVFERVGVPAGNPINLLTIRFGNQRHTLQATTTNATIPLIAASVPANTAWLAVLASTTAPIDITSVDTIRVPPAPAIGYAISACS